MLSPLARRLRVTLVALPLLGSLFLSACDKVDLTAPTDSSITLTTSQTVLPVTGKAEITATVTESAGTPVQNGTMVYFTSTVGVIDPREARTENGRARVTFAGNGTSGTAKIGATSGSAVATEIEIKVGGAAASRVVINVSPTAVPTTGGTVTLLATVTDADGNRLPGVPVSFTSTAGVLANSTVVSDDNGQARTTLTTSAQASVSASAGAAESGSIAITVASALQLTLTAPTGTLTAGTPLSFGVGIVDTNASPARLVTLDFGDGSSQQLGSLSGTTTVAHTYGNAGTYTVTLTAVDQLGQAYSRVAVISVGARAPLIVNVTASPNTPNVQAVVTINVAVQPAATQVQRYEYNFGDGIQTTLASSQTTHFYATAGNKVITVRVVAVDGSSATGRTEINVIQP